MTQRLKPHLTKEDWEGWDKEQKIIMKKLKKCQKNKAGIMEITMRRAFQIAEEKKYKELRGEDL